MNTRTNFGNYFIQSAKELKENDYHSSNNPSLKNIFQRNAIHNSYYGAFHLAYHFAERVTTLLSLPSVNDTSKSVHTNLISFYLNTSNKINKEIKERVYFELTSKNLDILRGKRNTADYTFQNIGNIDSEIQLCLKISTSIKSDIEKLHLWLDGLESKNR